MERRPPEPCRFRRDGPSRRQRDSLKLRTAKQRDLSRKGLGLGKQGLTPRIPCCSGDQSQRLTNPKTIGSKKDQQMNKRAFAHKGKPLQQRGNPSRRRSRRPKPHCNNDFRCKTAPAACSASCDQPHPARANPSRNLSEAIPPVKVLRNHAALGLSCSKGATGRLPSGRSAFAAHTLIQRRKSLFCIGPKRRRPNRRSDAPPPPYPRRRRSRLPPLTCPRRQTADYLVSPDSQLSKFRPSRWSPTIPPDETKYPNAG